MPYNPALWDGSDPLYAPGLSWKKNYATWKAPARYVKAGYKAKSIKLHAGHKDDGHALERAQKCREYTREMLNGGTAKTNPAFRRERGTG